MRYFFELLQVALGRRKGLSGVPSPAEWRAVYEEAERQTISGVMLDGLERLPAEQRPPHGLLLQWIGKGERLRQQNGVLDRRCAEVTRLFADAGFPSCILKGQGNARMYPVPERRQPGDIDLWVFGDRRAITRFVKERCPDAFEQYHHIDFPIFNDVPVEVHYTPGQLMRPRYNRRFQAWCDAQGMALRAERLETGDDFRVPSVAFNAVYQMAHIMIHFFIEGIGMRHFVDYYYVLTHEAFTDRTVAVETLRHLGMERFARGVMWIEQYCLGLEDSRLLLEPSEQVGRLLLQEMEAGGNFGHHDSRYASQRKGLMTRGWADTQRLLTLASVFPAESLWKIVRKIGNQRWKLKNI